jgi:GT2 family glycosyltransferase
MSVPASLLHSRRMLTHNEGEPFTPVRMLDIELARPLPTVTFDGRHRRLCVLGRLHTEPVGVCIVNISQEGLTSDQLAAALWPEFRESVSKRFTAAGLSVPGVLMGDGLKADPAAWPFVRRRLAKLATAPFISVIICTRDRPDSAKNCLRHLARQNYPRFEIILVDNAPTSNAVRAFVDAWHGERPLRYVLESRPGLSWARNAGIAASSGEIVAFLDDDEEPDSQWLVGLACGFAQGTDIACVSGMVLPARLDTEAQELFEQFGGHCQGRSFTPVIFSAQGPQSPLFPLPPFGVGANMAFRREALAEIGGFDVALGAGTPTRAGEDTLALTLILLAGYRIAYEPTALTRHHHRDDLDGLSSQLLGYSVGLTAFYTALLRRRPSVLPQLLRLIPVALSYLRSAKTTYTSTAVNPLAQLERRQRIWMLKGPAAYLRSRRIQARTGPSSAPRHSESTASIIRLGS